MVNTHFAKMENNKIIDIVVLPVFSMDIKEQEKIGIDYLSENTGYFDWLCVGAHKGFCAINGTYDEMLDRFIPPKINPSFVLNEEYVWVTPIPYPQDGKIYEWDEEKITWVLFEVENS